MNVELLIADDTGTTVYKPVVEEDIEWSTERKDTPGKLVFKVVWDEIIDFSEGSAVRLIVYDYNVFY